MPDDHGKGGSPFGEEPTGGRYLLGGICVAAIALLTMIRWQTTPGSMGQTSMSGGWWAEPVLAPAVVLVLTIAASGLGFWVTRRDRADLGETFGVYARVLVVAGCMIGAVMLTKVLGFALSILVFAGVVAMIAGFRGLRLALIALGTTLAMVLIFRVGFSIWFPRPMLFKWIDFPIWLQGIL